VRDGQRWFGWINLVPWAIYLGISLAFGAGYGMSGSGVLLLFVTIALALYLVSGGLRALTLSRGWLQRDGWALSGRLLAAVLIGALVVQAMVALVMVPLHAPEPQPATRAGS